MLKNICHNVAHVPDRVGVLSMFSYVKCMLEYLKNDEIVCLYHTWYYIDGEMNFKHMLLCTGSNFKYVFCKVL